MRPFYITKGRCGYYRIRLVDMASGLIVCDRSSRTSDRKAAERLAWEWVRDGISPVTKKSSDKKSLDTKPSRAVSAPVENSVPLGGLSESEELALLKLLAKKHGFSLGSESSVLPVAENVTVADKKTAEIGERDFALEKITDADLPLSLSCKKFDAGIFNGVKVSDFITDFWTEEKSPYYEQQKAHRKDINGTHCQNMRDMVKRYWIPFFGNSTVDSLTTEILNKFFIYLAADKGLKSSTVNKVLNSAAVPFKFYCKNHKISSNPMDGIERFGCDKTERGILTREEVERLFSFEWENKKKQLANMLAAFTGMRAGEVSALRYCDIYDDRIYVNHNWSVVDGEKDPKRHEVRWVVCPPEICSALKALAKKNPSFSNDCFVFFSRQKKGCVPVLPEAWVRGLDEALEQIGISSEARKARHIDFHSWRHFFATEISERVQMGTAQKLLGHKDASTTAIYASHESEEHMAAVQNVMAEFRKNIRILPFQLVA
ncbi:MAG: site-specific integrase [Treponema sp.]|uniref:tyrosine-type recombinase/integrase n=1 Tax=Treponema sp. TaxID=166 RepID=UPI0025FB1566|nr:site-specific integrase [Treponema sp.]MBQ8680430.1 site-specific integrase [Treponema sp.]